MISSQSVDRRREFRLARYVRMRLEAAEWPWRTILIGVAAAAIGAWTIGFLAGLLVIWFGSR